MPTTNTYPRYPGISGSRKTRTIYHIPNIRSTEKPNEIRLSCFNRLCSHRGTTRHVIACPHRDQHLCHMLLSLRQAFRTSDWRGSPRLTLSNSRASLNSLRQGFEAWGLHWWTTKRRLHFRPHGSVVCCRLRWPSLHSKLYQPAARYTIQLLLLFGD